MSIINGLADGMGKFVQNFTKPKLLKMETKNYVFIWKRITIYIFF